MTSSFAVSEPVSLILDYIPSLESTGTFPCGTGRPMQNLFRVNTPEGSYFCTVMCTFLLSFGHNNTAERHSSPNHMNPTERDSHVCKICPSAFQLSRHFLAPTLSPAH
ncbi:21_t:CDS:1, partial [Diversispora eburnea]